MDNPFAKPHYLDKFGLKEPPYSTIPDERYLFLTDNHQEAIHMCGRLINGREAPVLSSASKAPARPPSCDDCTAS